MLWCRFRHVCKWRGKNMPVNVVLTLAKLRSAAADIQGISKTLKQTQPVYHDRWIYSRTNISFFLLPACLAEFQTYFHQAKHIFRDKLQILKCTKRNRSSGDAWHTWSQYLPLPLLKLCIRADRAVGVREWTPAGVSILCRSWNQKGDSNHLCFTPRIVRQQECQTRLLPEFAF